MTEDMLIDYFTLEKTEQVEIIQACALMRRPGTERVTSRQSRRLYFVTEL